MAARSIKAESGKAAVKEALLTEIAKATKVGKAEVEKVLDHLGLNEKLNKLDPNVTKTALQKVTAADLKIAIKLAKGAVVL